MKNICIFCSACEDIKPIYFERARQLGEWMGVNGYDLVYGGVDLGLMGCTARAVKSSGGKLTGVVPGRFEDDGKISQLCDTIIQVADLSERKDRMVQLADCIIALPGGVGTLDEVFTVMAAASVGYHGKRVIFYNMDGFYDRLVSLMQGLRDEGFLRHPLDEYFLVADNLEEIISSLQQYGRKH